jgi:HlyD family secretion protein
MKIRAFFTKKKIIFGTIIILIVGFIGFQIYKSKNDTSNIIVDNVKRQDLKQTVLATGEVVSSIDLSLSFKVSGIVNSIKIKVGDKIRQGTVLANLEQRDQLASLTSARGSLALAEANYQKVLAGATTEDIAVSQEAVNTAKINLENIKQAQDTAVNNALSTLLNTGLVLEENNNIGTLVTVTLSGAYNSSIEGQYIIRPYSSSGGTRLSITGLENYEAVFNSNTLIPLGSRGLYMQFSSSNLNGIDYWVVNIPNKKAANYVTYYNAYKTALETRKSSVDSAQAAYDQAVVNLNLKKSQARPVDLAVYQAQITSAQGQVQAALSQLENTIIRAPSNGTITKVDIKVGELATALSEAMILQDVESLHLEANISEANISALKPGQSIEVTYDSQSPDDIFQSKVQYIDPASTVVSGVVNYKVTASLENVNTNIKPGMTANMTILTDEKKGVLAIPQRAVSVKNGKKYAKLITDPKSKTFKEVEISTGLEADGGLVEVLAGLNENDSVVSYIKTK